jgi:hypothetical protein
VDLQENTQYQLSFWVKGEGLRDLKYVYSGREGDPATDSFNFQDHATSDNINLSKSWNRETENVSWSSSYGQKGVTIGFSLQFNFVGQGTFYLSDVELHQVP